MIVAAGAFCDAKLVALAIVSTALVVAIDNAQAFRRGLAGAWLGLVPRQYSTGCKSTLDSISKRGNSYLRQLLIQGAQTTQKQRQQNQQKKTTEKNKKTLR